MWSAVDGRVRGMGCAVLALLLASAVPGFGRGVTKSQLARLDPQTESTSVLLETTKELLKNEQLDDALPFLEEVLVRLEGDDEKKARQTLAFTLFQLAYCEMQLGQFVSAAKHYVRFCDEFPDDPQMEEARVMAAQCLTMMQQWSGAEEQAALVLKNPTLAEELKVTAVQILAESLYQQERWAEAAKPLAALYRLAKTDVVRSSAAVMRVTCYVRMDDFENLFRFLPLCDVDARHNVGLNVALLEAGDSHYNRGEYLKALLLYRLVFLKKNLLAHYEARIRETRLQLKPYIADGKQTLSEFKKKQAVTEKKLTRLTGQYKAIVGFRDYDMEVALRIAQSYNDLGRNWPAHAIYQEIYTNNPTNELADHACFSAFSVMLDEQEWKQAVVEGLAYVEKRPDGEFTDDVTLNLMQVHMHQNQFDLALDAGKKALEISPEHKYIDQVTYLMAYVNFSQLDYADALAGFSRILTAWPESRYYESAEYWRAMSQLFLGTFPEAEHTFTAYLTNPKYDPKIYEEDASYRLGIAQYGAEKYIESEDTFRAFVEDYPESSLLSEAYAMLGDLRAAEGDLAVALDFYRRAREKAMTMPQVNYPLFQAAKVMERGKQYTEIIELMTAYIDEYEEKGDLANAVNWAGKAHKALGRYRDALKVYLSAIDKIGNDAQQTGADLILNTIISDYKSDEWADYRSLIMDHLDEHLAAAREQGQRTLQLNYQTLFAGITSGDQRRTFVDSIAQSKNVPAAGSGTLVLMAKEGVLKGDYELVHEAADRFMADFETSGNMLQIALANMDAFVGQKRYEDALALSDEILTRFGYSPSVGRARKLRGDVFRLCGDYEQALDAYKEVLAIREWRGPLTPETLFNIGLCKMEQEKFDEAFAHFQRIYVLYEDYTLWVAPAYEKSIECLAVLGGHEQDIINTYREMLANEAVAETPEGRAARERLRELEPAGEVL
jgi:tetratricopeptide (TPR) repeat protein